PLKQRIAYRLSPEAISPQRSAISDRRYADAKRPHLPWRGGAGRFGAGMAARTPAPRAPRAPRTAWVALALFVVLGTIYTCNFRLGGAGDSIPTRLLPFSVLREGDLDLDEFTFERGPSGRLPYYVHPRDGHLWSVSTIATALVVTPLYVVPAAWLASTG